jgi:dTMP kinase
MHKVKPLFITFEGIEGSGKSYLSKKLYKFLKNKKLPVVLTREPGGSKSAEKIRSLVLKGEKDKFLKTTDTLLYLASRNEHINKKIKPSIKSNNIIICDRFLDSTYAYQVYGSKVKKDLVDNVHKHILGSTKPNITFILYVNLNKAFNRINKRGKKNRYDKLSKNFYKNVQNGFLKIAKKNKKKYLVVDNSLDSGIAENIIISKCKKLLKL